MAKATVSLASSSSPPNTTSSPTQPGTPEATIVDPWADSVQVHHFPDALRRPRSLRPRRAAASIPLAHTKLNPLKEKADVDDEPHAVDPKVMKLRITGPKLKKLKSDQVIDPSDPDTRRLRILAEVCHDRLLAFGDVSSSSDNCLRKS